jgi:hypothetical protein
VEIKLFEIRDRATLIPAMAIRNDDERTRKEYALLARAGFRGRYVLLIHLEGMQINYDMYNWSNRTMAAAHDFIESNWRSLTSGDVIDVEYILGESDKKKESEINQLTRHMNDGPESE